MAHVRKCLLSINLATVLNLLLLTACGHQGNKNATPVITDTPVRSRSSVGLTLPPTFTTTGTTPIRPSATPAPTETPFLSPSALPTSFITTATPGSQVTPENDVIGGWETYRNEEYGYEIQHPPDWILSDTFGSVYIESENCIFMLEEREDVEYLESLGEAGCSYDKVVFNEIPMTRVSCPNRSRYPESHYFPRNGKYLSIWYSEKLQESDYCQKNFEQMLSTFSFFRAEGEASAILESVLEKLPQGFRIAGSFYVDFDGDGIKEIAIVRGPYFEEPPDIYIFKQDPMTDDVSEIYYDDGDGVGIDELSASDLDQDGKEELLIVLNLGGNVGWTDWSLLSEKDSVIKSYRPPSFECAYLQEGADYFLAFGSIVQIIGGGLISELLPLHLDFEGAWLHSVNGGWLDAYYQFRNNEITVFAYEFSPTDDYSDWNIHKDVESRYVIRFPKNISIFEDEKGIILDHSIPFDHQDPCASGEVEEVLTELTDFQIRIEVSPQSLIETVRANETYSFASEFDMGDELAVVPGIIDKVQIGSLKGYRIKSGDDGCGSYRYYFPLNSQSTLFVVRSRIPELIPSISAQWLELPELIPPFLEDNLFNIILSTFKFNEDYPEWKSYRNVAYANEIKYPPDAELIKQEEDRIRIEIPLHIHFPSTTTSTGTTPEFTVELNARLEIAALDMDCSSQECLYPGDVLDMESQWQDVGDFCVLAPVHSGEAAGFIYTAKKYLCSTPTMDRHFVISLLFRHPSSLGRYLSSFPPEFEERFYSEIAQHEEIGDQIISTFRLLEK